MKLCISFTIKLRDNDEKPSGGPRNRDRGMQGVADPVFASIVSRVLGLRPGPTRRVDASGFRAPGAARRWSLVGTHSLTASGAGVSVRLGRLIQREIPLNPAG